jgi:serpin B
MILQNIFFTLLFFLTTLPGFSQTKKTVEGNSVFAFDLFKNVFSENKNTFISPYSISSALAMTYAGARGETEKQMSRVLRYDLNQVNTHEGFSELNKSISALNNDSTIKLSIANALWKSESWHFYKEYLDLTQKYYNAEIYPLKGAKPINDWADKNTNGKIKVIVHDSDLPDNTRMVLTNAIYFKGDWLTAFSESATRKTKFIISEKENTDVDMMFQENEVNYFEDVQNQVLELPYKGETMSMTFVLPKDGYSLNKLSSINQSNLFDIYHHNLSKQKVKIFIPKFSFSTEYHLKEVLPKMGMPDAFDVIKADFTGMSGGLSISDVIHKAFIEVNEKGSEAAAVTAVIMIEKAAPREIVFNANRPFMIFITDKKTGSILFMGSIMNPNEN